MRSAMYFAIALIAVPNSSAEVAKKAYPVRGSSPGSPEIGVA